MITQQKRPNTTQYTYDDYLQTGPAPVHRYLWPTVRRELSKRISDGAKLLDAGCGNGALCAVLSERYDVCGFDLSRPGIQLAEQSSPACRFRVASVYDPLGELFQEEFDAVVSLEVIEHLYAPREFVKRVREVLAPGGLFILSTPYHGYLKNLAIAASGRFDKHFDPLYDGGHIKFWSKASLGTLLGEFGFQLLCLKPVGRVPWLWKSMIAVCRRRG